MTLVRYLFSQSPQRLMLTVASRVLAGANWCQRYRVNRYGGLCCCSASRIVLNGATVNDAHMENYRQYFSDVFSDFALYDHVAHPARHDQDEQIRYLLEKLDLAPVFKQLIYREILPNLKAVARRS